MRRTLHKLEQGTKELDATTQQLSPKAALAHLKTGPTQGADINGEPPQLYLDALLQGAAKDLTVTLLTRDESLPQHLAQHGARVWVGPPPTAANYSLIAYQERGVLIIRSGDGQQKCSWQPASPHSGALHRVNMQDFAPYRKGEVWRGYSAPVFKPGVHGPLQVRKKPHPDSKTRVE